MRVMPKRMSKTSQLQDQVFTALNHVLGADVVGFTIRRVPSFGYWIVSAFVGEKAAKKIIRKNTPVAISSDTNKMLQTLMKAAKSDFIWFYSDNYEITLFYSIQKLYSVL